MAQEKKKGRDSTSFSFVIRSSKELCTCTMYKYNNWSTTMAHSRSPSCLGGFLAAACHWYSDCLWEHEENNKHYDAFANKKTTNKNL